MPELNFNGVRPPTQTPVNQKRRADPMYVITKFQQRWRIVEIALEL